MARNLRQARLKVGKGRNKPRRAVVLLAVLVVIVILALLGYQYLELTANEYETAINVERSVQSRLCAESGVHFVAALLANPNDPLQGNTYDNPDAFLQQPVVTDDATGLTGYFSVVAPVQQAGMTGGEGQVRFGVIDEGGKINLNAMMVADDRNKGDTLEEMLRKLPYMEEDTAAAIVDWLDPDIEPRQGGAEDEVYSSLEPPYRCKNGPIDSLDELLLVRGVTPELLYGNDLNRNGMIDGNEVSTDPLMDLGWSAYLTIYSREQNITWDHKLRVNLNEKDLSSLHTKLSARLGTALANYIILYRQNGGRRLDGAAESTGEDPSNANLDFNKRGRTRLRSLLELLNSEVSVREPGGQTKVYASPLNDRGQQEQLLPLLFDQCTVTDDTDIPARININTAPEAVIRALPQLSEEDVEKILAKRPPPGSLAESSPVYQTPAWLVVQAELDARLAQDLEKYITTRSQVFRVQVIGEFAHGGPWSRVEAVIDTNAGRPRILMFRDLSRLGKGFILADGGTN